MSLAPQASVRCRAADPDGRDQSDPDRAGCGSERGGGYLVQVSSQKNEADAQASFRVAAGQVPDGARARASPVIKRADLGEKGVYYRAMVGPFGSPEEAAQFCSSLKTAGGQCVVQRN